MAAAPVVTHFSQCTQNFFRKRISSKVISHPPVQSIKVRSQMMPPEVKKYLSRNIQSQFDKDPAIQPGQVKKWLLSGNQLFDLSTIKSNTLSKFISYQLEKLRNTGNLTRKRGSGGHNKTPPRVVNRIKKYNFTEFWPTVFSLPLVFSSYLPSYFTKFNIQGQFWTQNYMRIPKLVLL